MLRAGCSPRLAAAAHSAAHSARRRLSLPVRASSMHSLSVAVVGGGAAGLAAAKELLAAGHRVTVLESRPHVGGVWDYTEEVEDDPLGRGLRHVHGSMYRQLRTNLPREVMGFADFPFDDAFSGSQDPRQFCGHAEVQRYLEAFAQQFDLLRHVRLHTEVLRLAPVAAAPPTPAVAGVGSSSDAAGNACSSSGKEASSGSASSSGAASRPGGWVRWEVTTRAAASQGNQQQQQQHGAAPAGVSREEFDAVVVCNGHYSRPRLPEIPGQDVFPGLVMHSHNYRTPEQFRGQRVVLLGASSSGVDIAEEIAAAGAERTYLCAREWENPLTGQVLDISDSSIPGSSSGNGNGGSSGGGSSIIKGPNIAELHADGSVSLADGSRLEGIHTVMFCTGYNYAFPFLEGTGLVAVEDNRVGPLFQHIFPPAVAPTLSFVGLCWKVVPFPQFELQSRYIAKALAGTIALPSQQEMERGVAEFYASLAAAGVPQRYTHRQSGGVQWAYARWLAERCGQEPWLSWREEMYTACGLSRKLNAGRYRDCPLPGVEAAEAAAREDAAAVRRRLQLRTAEAPAAA